MIFTFNQLLVKLAGQLSEDMIEKLNKLCSEENDVIAKLNNVRRTQDEVLNYKLKAQRMVDSLAVYSKSYSKCKRLRSIEGVVDYKRIQNQLGYTMKGFEELTKVSITLPNGEILESNECDLPVDLFKMISHASKCLKAFVRYLDRCYSNVDKRLVEYNRNINLKNMTQQDAYNLAFKGYNRDYLKDFKFPTYIVGGNN